MKNDQNKENKEKIQWIKFDVSIPAIDGSSTQSVVTTSIPVIQDDDGDQILTQEARDIIEDIKLRHMGLLSPEEILFLRKGLNLSQASISNLLQIGEKTWTRWENGRERPTRSMNVLLSALRDGKITVAYLASLRNPGPHWTLHDYNTDLMEKIDPSRQVAPLTVTEPDQETLNACANDSIAFAA